MKHISTRKTGTDVDLSYTNDIFVSVGFTRFSKTRPIVGKLPADNSFSARTTFPRAIKEYLEIHRKIKIRTEEAFDQQDNIILGCFVFPAGTNESIYRILEDV